MTAAQVRGSGLQVTVGRNTELGRGGSGAGCVI